VTITELARQSHVNAETIRKYRNQGLLLPRKNPENGYYEYSQTDLVNLLNIRKLRGANLSLDTINYTHHHSDLCDILDHYRGELEQLNREIEALQTRQYMLQITLDHLAEYQSNAKGVTLIDAFDARYDCYFSQHKSLAGLDVWLDHVGLFTQTVGISQEALTQKPLPEYLPIELGLGSYETILRKNDLPIPDRAVFLPKGKYLTLHISLDRLDCIPSAQLRPIFDYVEEHHCRIASNTTAFLFRVDYSGSTPRFIYRLRVRIE
jgi:DNA-binding transcriptional MerR regulator